MEWHGLAHSGRLWELNIVLDERTPDKHDVVLLTADDKQNLQAVPLTQLALTKRNLLARLRDANVLPDKANARAAARWDGKTAEALASAFLKQVDPPTPLRWPMLDEAPLGRVAVSKAAQAVRNVGPRISGNRG